MSILLPLPFGLVTFSAVPLCIYETYLSNKKFEIHDNCIVSYEPLRKARKIDLNDLGSIYIVLHTIPGGRRFISGLEYRDLDKRIIYDVILLKRGCPDHYIKSDASDCFFSSCKEYIMYDFDFNANTVLELLKRTKSNVYTNKEMYDLMIKDRLFNEYKDKIVLTDLAHPPHMWYKD